MVLNKFIMHLEMDRLIYKESTPFHAIYSILLILRG